MILTLYRGLTTLGEPLIDAVLGRRAARGKEDPARLGERRGAANKPRPQGRVIWVHAASVGEALSVLPIVERIQARKGMTILLTTGTVASAELIKHRLPPGAIHQYAPVDRVPWVRRFLDHWRPDLALWCESEFWPNLLIETSKRMPMILLNGRVSDRSFARWRQRPRLIRTLLSAFALCLGQTPTDASRLQSLGARRVACLGNLKFASPELPVDQTTLDRLVGEILGRPRWLAASTHAGEEAMAARIHQILAPEFPGLLSIVVPRHPARAADIAAEFTHANLTLAKRSEDTEINSGTDILLGDTMGELGLFIRLAPIVFVGKSISAKGGQNPLEPARLGASVLFGPHMDNFADLTERLVVAGGAEQIADEAALTEALRRRLADPALVGRSGALARGFAATEAGVLDAIMASIEPWLAAHIPAGDPTGDKV